MQALLSVWQILQLDFFIEGRGVQADTYPSKHKTFV